MRLRTFLLVIILPLTAMLSAQSPDSCDLRFAEHLVNTGNFAEALFYIDSTGCIINQVNDTASYLRGISYYSQKKLDLSSESFLKIPENSAYYLKSRYFSAYNYSHLGESDKALEILSGEGVKREQLIPLNSFEKAGVYLLKGDTISFRREYRQTDLTNYAISGSAENINKIAHDLEHHKVKSPVAAGIFSAVIPGSGKFYAGTKGGAISAFIATTGLALVTLENNNKCGTRSFPTIFFGTAFIFSYISNIYGSAAAARVVENEYRKNVRNSILYNMHIPLRNTFDK